MTPPSNINNPPIVPAAAAGGGFTVQSVVTGSRALDGTIYHNAGATPMLVIVTVSLASGNNNTVAYSDTNASPSTEVCRIATSTLVGGAISMELCFIVLAGSYYLLTQTGGTLSKWVEYT